VGWIAILIVGAILGWITEAYLMRREYPGHLWGAIIAGIVGAWIGGKYLGAWGWMLDGVIVIGSSIVALILSYVVGLFGEEVAGEKRDAP